MPEQNGIEKARETAAKLKGQVHEEKKEAAARVSSLASANLSEATLAFFKNHASKGIGDIPMVASLPVLRVHQMGSTKNVLDDGSEPAVGQFFHTGTKQVYDKPVVHLLSIRKCKLPRPKDSENEETEYQSHYLVAGVLQDGGQPFVMYIKGLSYNKVWDLQDQLKPWVKNRQQPIPMFALSIELYSEKEQDQNKKYAPQRVVKYKLMMTDAGFPQFESAVDRLEWLSNAVDSAEDALADIIATYGQVEVEAATPLVEAELTVDEATAALTEGKDPEDIPF